MRRWMLRLADEKEIICMQRQKSPPPRIPQPFRWFMGYNAPSKFNAKINCLA